METQATETIFLYGGPYHGQTVTVQLLGGKWLDVFDYGSQTSSRYRLDWNGQPWIAYHCA